LVSRLEINGIENFPEKGPLMMVGNHFSFVDPVCFVRVAPPTLEFVGGADTPHAPKITRALPLLVFWGYSLKPEIGQPSSGLQDQGQLFSPREPALQFFLLAWSA